MSAPNVAAVGRRRRAALGTSGVAHFLHDGLSDALYVLLPMWAQAFGLSHAQVGLLKSIYSGSMAVFQVPVGILAERWGERALLAAGTLAAGLAYLLLGAVGGFVGLALLLLLAGLASGTQHPLSSSLVSRAFAEGRRRAALGTYNFTGDLGKVVFPVLVASVAAAWSWRHGSVLLGSLGVVGGIGLFLVLRQVKIGGPPSRKDTAEPRPKAPRRWGIRDRRGFGLLSAISMLDNAIRIGFLTFLPFLLIDKGAEVEAVGFALALVLGGGAAGKLICGLLGERFGILPTIVVTETLTGLGILALLFLPLWAAIGALPLVGLALNGTSSVLYGTVPEFVAPESQSRAFGLFYTLGASANAVSPTLCGLLSDAAGLPVALAVVGLSAFGIIPICRLLAPSLVTVPNVR